MKRLAAAGLAAVLLAPAIGEAGSFKGASGHMTFGTVEAVRTAEGWEIRFGADFSFDGAPDPWVGFGEAGRFAAGTAFAELRANSGAQVYKVPGDIDPTAYDDVFIWCKRYAVPLGVARLD